MTEAYDLIVYAKTDNTERAISGKKVMPTSRWGSSNMATTSWVFVTFGESHLEALYLTDDTARDPPPEIHFTHVFPLKMVNFYPPTPVYDLTGDRLTKNDEDP